MRAKAAPAHEAARDAFPGGCGLPWCGASLNSTDGCECPFRQTTKEQYRTLQAQNQGMLEITGIPAHRPEKALETAL